MQRSSASKETGHGKTRDITARTFNFAVEIISLCQLLEAESGVCRILGRQLLRSGTSIGANVEEAQAGQSRADFVHKYSIALKEARETAYWLRLLGAAQLAPHAPMSQLLTEAEELKRILGAIIVSAKQPSDSR